MHKIKQRKRLTVISIVFLLVFLTGAAFALTPGVLEVNGRVGVMEQRNVIWSLAHTPHYTAGNNPALGQWDNHAASIMFNMDRSPGAGRDLAYLPQVSNRIFMNNSAIASNERVATWDVVFRERSADTARIYLEAANLNETMVGTIDAVNLQFVATTGVALSEAEFGDIFHVSGTYTTLPGAELAMRGAPLACNRIPIVYIDIAWNGELPASFHHSYFFVDADGQRFFVGTLTLTVSYTMAPLDGGIDP